MSTLKVDTLDTRTGSGNITFSRPTVLQAGDIVTADLADDAVTTAKILADAVTTAKVLDANVTTAKVADNAITLAKMAGGTDGQVITYDASGDPVAVGPGTDGQVLTSTGAGSPPAFEAVAAGWTQGTEAVTALGSAQYDFTGIPAGVKIIQIGFENVSLSGSSSIIVQLGDSGGFEAAGYASGSSTVNSGASVMLSDSGLGYVIRIGSAARSFNGVMTLVNKDAAAFDWSSMHAGKQSNTDTVHGGGWSDLSHELTSIRITTINGSDSFDLGAININYL